ncbi:MAG: hypothetical protein U1C33_08760, partial [Candidatus Cloacimonadaceae bacterium]|nr:hypothetical protein [Candidatus Cloacimonadaceae bacterium]
MKRIVCIVCLLMIGFFSLLHSITLEDIEFCLQRELRIILQKNHEQIIEPIQQQTASKEWLQTVIDYAKFIQDAQIAADCHYQLATRFHDLESAVQWIILASSQAVKAEEYETQLSMLKRIFI